jgi:hypothetical protein
LAAFGIQVHFLIFTPGENGLFLIGQSAGFVGGIASLTVNPLHRLLAQGFVETQGFDAFAAELGLAAVGPLDIDLVVAKIAVIEHLRGNAGVIGLAFLGCQLQVGGDDFPNMLGSEFAVFIAKVLAQLAVELAGIDQLHLALALARFVIGQQPDIGGDAGVVKQVVGQLDDRFEPVVFDNVPADIAFAAAFVSSWTLPHFPLSSLECAPNIYHYGEIARLPASR